VADAGRCSPETRFTRGVLGGCARSRCAGAHALLVWPRTNRLAAVHHRQHRDNPRRSGSTIRASIRPWEAAGELGIPICMQMSKQAFPQLINLLKRFPAGKKSFSITWRGPRARRRAPHMRPPPVCSRLARFPSHPPQGRPPPHVSRNAATGKGNAGDILSEAGRRISAPRRIAWGVQLPGLGGPAQESACGRAPPLGCVPAAARSGLDFRQGPAQSLYPAFAATT